MKTLDVIPACPESPRPGRLPARPCGLAAMTPWLTLVFIFASFWMTPAAQALVPAKPGVPVPQIVIDRYQQDKDKFYPRPMLTGTMARYAAAKRAAWQPRSGGSPQGLPADEVDDIYAHCPVICGLYSNSGANPWPISEIQSELFDGPWPTQTMSEYYEEVSYNQFHLDGTAYGWYRSQYTQAYVVGSYYGLGPDAHVGDFIVDLLEDCDPTTDFGQYDNDGPDNIPNSGDDDGIVDALYVIHDGPGGEIGANNIWSHSWSLQWAYGSNFVTDDPRTGGGYIQIGPYIIQPAVNGNGQIIEIGVFCHEFGHALGLPDLYDGDYSSQGVGVWCLMGGGSWNTPTYPAHPLAWCRYKLGWINPTQIATWLHDQPITPIETSGQAFMLWTQGLYDYQYFMVENRQRIGSDVNLPGEGLCIWHIDEYAQQTNEFHPLVDMEEADGLQQLTYNVNSGDWGDVFPGSSDNHWFDEYTNPSTLDYFGNPTWVAVWNISDEGDTMMANLDVVYSQPLLEFVDYALIDSTGNGDGRADPGETVELYVIVENFWAAVNNLQATLTTTSSYVDIVDSTGEYGYLAHQGTGGNAANPFQVYIHEDAPEGAWLPLNVHLTDGGNYAQDFAFSVQIGRAPILLVDDDLGQNFEQFIDSSLQETNINYEVWHVSQQGSPASQIMEYSAVIWMTGNDSLSTLSGTEMNTLDQFIAAGRTLILTGQNINEDLGTSNFFHNTLRCSPRTNDVNAINLSGDSTNALSAGMLLLIFGFGGAANQTSPSSVYPEGSQSLFIYNNGQVGGINYVDETSGAHVVYLAFGLEAVSGLGGTTSRADLLNAIFDWAPVTAVEPAAPRAGAPLEFKLNEAFPNPFNPGTVLSFQLPAASLARLSVYDISGRWVATLMDGWRAAGKHEVAFDGSSLASGIYLARLQAGQFAATQKMVLLK